MDYTHLNSVIDDFHRSCLHVSSASQVKQDDFRQLWQKVVEINEAFKSVRYPTRDDKDIAWQKYQEAIRDLKRGQEESRENARAFAQKSEKYRDEILRVIEKARRPGLLESLISFFTTDLILGSGDLAASIFFPSLDPVIEELKRKKDELRDYNSSLQEARDLFRLYKGEMTGKHKQEVFQTISEIGQQLDQAWDEWKKAWAKAHQIKQESYQNKTRQFIENQETFLKKLYDALARKEDHLRDLHYKLDGASENYKGRVYDWIREEENKINDIKGKIKEVDGKIDDANRRLR